MSRRLSVTETDARQGNPLLVTEMPALCQQVTVWACGFTWLCRGRNELELQKIKRNVFQEELNSAGLSTTVIVILDSDRDMEGCLS